MSSWRGVEFIEEFEWLTENGMSMIMASQLLGRRPEASERYFHRYNRHDLASGLRGEMSWPNIPGGHNV
jgi:hypothetical protein